MTFSLKLIKMSGNNIIRMNILRNNTIIKMNMLRNNIPIKINKDANK